MECRGMIIVLTNADTEILALRVAIESLPEGFPEVRAANPTVSGSTAVFQGAGGTDEVQAVVVRLLGGARAWEGGLTALNERCRESGIPLIALGGEAAADTVTEAYSTISHHVVSLAREYFVQGGPKNLENLLRMLADSLLGTGFGYRPPSVVPPCGVLERKSALFAEESGWPSRPLVGVVFYRAHLLAGNTQFVEDLCAALEALGARALPVFAYSLRGGSDGASEAVAILEAAGVDTVVTTTLASGGILDGSTAWDPGELARLDVPVLQAICSTSPSARWETSALGLSPTDMAMSVAIPEFDGRIISAAFSFKESVESSDVLGSEISAYRTRPDRVERVAELAWRLATLRRTDPSERKVAVVLSAYPTKRSRMGNAVGLDTPASVVRLLQAMKEAGYTLHEIPENGDALMAKLAASLLDKDELQAWAKRQGGGDAGSLDGGPELLGTLDTAGYGEWFAKLPEELRAAVVEHWGPPPGDIGVVETSGDRVFVFLGLLSGNVAVALQPPRGFGENPVAVYHSPDLPPTHQYLAFYRFLDERFGAQAIVHVGKHGTLEWLPGKSAALSAACAPDAALGSVPLVYPFVVNDPGEGAQAKRRAHALIVDHLVPPLTRAETYDDLARLEDLLDEHARVAALDPSKLQAVRRRVWDCLVDAEIHRDLGLEERAIEAGRLPYEDDSFDELVAGLDAYLCELKDAQIRGGLHVLSRPPEGEAEVDFVLALTRLDQGEAPSLRKAVAAAIGVDMNRASMREVDAVEAECRRLVRICQERGWDPSALGGEVGAAEDPVVRRALEFACASLVPALRATTGEVAAVLAALDGRFVPPGPSGSPSRGQADVLPTGRNFYAIDPRQVPSVAAYEVGRRLAEALLERHLAEEGRLPRSVGLVVWGTAAMRTGGDDVAEALALLGVRPVWDPETSRVTGVEAISLEELGRARVDVTLRVSGFFRDAFSHVIDLFDQAVRLVSGLLEPEELNPLVGGSEAEPRVFGPKPGAYGSGILAAIDSGEWETEEDLAEVYMTWSAFAYGAGRDGALAREALERRLRVMDAAVKNQDNREHDIFDSDDYLQDHGGMLAAARAVGGREPLAFFGDSSDPGRPRVRLLAEEAARVVRSRVLNPKWISAMMRHGYKGAFEMAATVEYLFGYDATAHVAENWMYERITRSYVGDPEVRKFFAESNPWALKSISERLLEAAARGMWDASEEALDTLRAGLLEAEGFEEDM